MPAHATAADIGAARRIIGAEALHAVADGVRRHGHRCIAIVVAGIIVVRVSVVGVVIGESAKREPCAECDPRPKEAAMVEEADARSAKTWPNETWPDKTRPYA